MKCNPLVIDAILFDLSGTLIDDFFAVFQGYVDLYKEYKSNLPSEIDFRNTFQLPYPEFLVKQGFKDIKKAICFWKKRYTNYNQTIIIFPDVIPALENLKKCSIILGVVSQTPEDKVKENLKKFNLNKYFKTIIYDKWKPKPDGLHQALKQLNIKDPTKVIYIGDMKEDCQAARTANIHPWAIYRETKNFQTLEKLKQGKPKKILKTMTELNNYLS